MKKRNLICVITSVLLIALLTAALSSCAFISQQNNVKSGSDKDEPASQAQEPASQAQEATDSEKNDTTESSTTVKAYKYDFYRVKCECGEVLQHFNSAVLLHLRKEHSDEGYEVAQALLKEGALGDQEFTERFTKEAGLEMKYETTVVYSATELASGEKEGSYVYNGEVWFSDSEPVLCDFDFSDGSNP